MMVQSKMLIVAFPLGRRRQVGFNVKKRKRVSRGSLDKKTLLQAHRYVLFNSNSVDPFEREHIDLIRRQNHRLSPYEIDKTHSQTFPDWFRERDELKKHMTEVGSSENPQATQDSTYWKNDIYSKVKGPERRGRVRCLGKLPRHGSSSSNVDNEVQKLENLLGSLVAVLQVRFAEDPQVNAVLQAVAQEVPAASAPTDLTSNNHQARNDPN